RSRGALRRPNRRSDGHLRRLADRWSCPRPHRWAVAWRGRRFQTRSSRDRKVITRPPSSRAAAERPPASHNLVELVRRHHAERAPTALEVLKEAIELRGEITDDDRRVAAERAGPPEAAVYGISTFYDDLLQPRGERHVRVCTGTACFASCGEDH